ncbi:MAG: hypothetical protein ABJF88_10935 [Rhodothermales bacterium]
MRYVSLLLLAGFLSPVISPAAAQDGPVFYMTQHKIHQARVDSLTALTEKYDIPWHNFVADNVEGYERWHMRHDTGNEYNFMTVTMYPDWDMVRGDEIPFDDFGPGFAASMGMTVEEMEAEDGMVNTAFEWAYDGSEHIDQIWRPIARAIRSGNEDGDMKPDMVAYMTQFKIKPSRMDSLVALIQTYDVPWHTFVAENVEGYERFWMRHDTGNEYNFMVVTNYPNWDMMDSVPYDELFPKFAASQGMTMEEAEGMGVEEKFNWAYEGAEHMDQIWRPIVAADMGMEKMDEME